MTGSITIIGLGPGSLEYLAPAAKKALEESTLILGYTSYLQQIGDLFPEIPRLSSGMRHEIERAKKAIAEAKAGQHVAVVSGGDAGIYGMAGLILELIGDQSKLQVNVIPGISALNAAASVLGAPLMNDFAVISLSDYLTPIESILCRVRAAANADFVLCFYNPKGKNRVEAFNQTCEILLALLGPERLVGIVDSAYRPAQTVCITSLKDLPNAELGMNSIVLVGNSQTRLIRETMVTPRGYKLEEGDVQDETR
ncbi:MAG: precorrin-3B C(17)-methyltransferase [Anaerolineaceae bacterium]|nr:precorrin-3B C(17)-methyltransferase [Anaerolineaceae bacterium]